MGRRKNGVFPRATVHKASGRARVRLCGREYWLGPAGTKETDDRYRALVASWVESGGTAVDESVLAPPAAAAPAPVVVTVAPGKPVTVTTAAPAPAPLTIGGLLLRYLVFVRGNRTPAQLRKHARWWNARQVANALDSRTAVSVELLGPRMLREVRDELAWQPMKPTRGGKRVHRTRYVVNRTVQEIRSMIRWAVAEELVSADKLHALECVPPLRAGDGSPARESVPREGVPDSDVVAICPFLPPVLADLIWFCRLSACRPDEAFGLRMADLVPHGAGVWKYTPATHKNAHRGKAREIAIGRRGREILERWSGGKPETALVFSRSDVLRFKTEGTLPMRRSRASGERLTADFLRRSVRRACDAASAKRWTPYQLRHAGLQEARDLFGLETAQAVGGQSNARTAEIYARASFAKAAAFAAAHG